METYFIHCRSVNVCYQDYIKEAYDYNKISLPSRLRLLSWRLFSLFSLPLLCFCWIYTGLTSVKNDKKWLDWKKLDGFLACAWATARLLRISCDRDTQRNFLGRLFEEGFILDIQTNLKIRGSFRVSLHVVPWINPYEMRHYLFSILKLVNETIYKLSRF